MAKILIIDDDQAVCESLRDVLEAQNFQCEYSLTGENCEELLRQSAADLLLLDYRMPGQSGEEVIRELSGKNGNSCPVPVIMLTGIDDEDQKVRLLELGADDYITKPYSAKELG